MSQNIILNGPYQLRDSQLRDNQHIANRLVFIGLNNRCYKALSEAYFPEVWEHKDFQQDEGKLTLK